MKVDRTRLKTILTLVAASVKDEVMDKEAVIKDLTELLGKECRTIKPGEMEAYIGKYNKVVSLALGGMESEICYIPEVGNIMYASDERFIVSLHEMFGSSKVMGVLLSPVVGLAFWEEDVAEGKVSIS